MEGGTLVREARRRAGLTQRELASRAGITQPTVARIEKGISDPGLEMIRRLTRLCGLDLNVRLVEWDTTDWAVALTNLRLDREARIRQHASALRFASAGRRALADTRAHA